MTETNTRYAYWARELKLQSKGLAGQERQNVDTHKIGIDGYWRIKGAKTKPDYPVNIWTAENGSIICQIGRMQPFAADENREAETKWFEFLTGSFLKTIAVTEDEYHVAMASGFWPFDGKPSRQQAEGASAHGDNEAPADESLADQIAILTEKLDAAPEPTTQAEANKLAGELDRMRALLKAAETAREAEKAPHLEAGRQVDAKWKEIATPGGDAYRGATARQKAFLLKEEQRREQAAREEQRRLEAERRAQQEAALAAALEAERVAREAAAAIEALPDERTFDGMAEVAQLSWAQEQAQRAEEELERLSAPAPEVKAAPATAGTAFGRNSGLKTVAVGRITDRKVFTLHLLESNDAGLLEYLDKRVAQLGKTRVTVPGMEWKEQRQ